MLYGTVTITNELLKRGVLHRMLEKYANDVLLLYIQLALSEARERATSSTLWVA